MPQTSAIMAFLAAAFLVFITQRGELRLYWGMLVGNTGASVQAPSQAQAPQNGVSFNQALSMMKAGARMFGGGEAASAGAAAVSADPTMLAALI